MKDFLSSAGIVLLIIVALMLPIEWLATKTTNDSSVKRDYLESHHSQISTLLMGHSHFECSFNPHVLGDSAFILAQVGRKIFFDVQLLKKYMPTLENLRTVVYPINIGDLDPGSNFALDWVAYAKTYGIYPKTFPENLQSRSLFLSHQFSKNWFNLQVTVDSLGYAEKQNKWDGQHAEFRPKKHSEEEISMFTSELKALAEMCKERGVRFVTMACPLTNLYLEKLSGDFYKDMYHIVEEVQKEYPMEFHDYTRDSLFRADTLFMDINHLNHTGATLFAKCVKEDFGL